MERAERLSQAAAPSAALSSFPGSRHQDNPGTPFDGWAAVLTLSLGTSSQVSVQMLVLFSWCRLQWCPCVQGTLLETIHIPQRLWLQPGFPSQTTSCSSDADFFFFHILEEVCQPGFSIQSHDNCSGLPQSMVHGRSGATAASPAGVFFLKNGLQDI